jgi:hypothetical protein
MRFSTLGLFIKLSPQAPKKRGQTRFSCGFGVVEVKKKYTWSLSLRGHNFREFSKRKCPRNRSSMQNAFSRRVLWKIDSRKNRMAKNTHSLTS